MKNEDVQLVYRSLAGDEVAFTTLVKKYQKNVHALAWRKVGDFHIAEELTQDTFLKAYEKLATLKNPSRFAGWLYVIANRLCIAWHRKQKPSLEYLETTSGEEIEASSYRHYEDEQREEASVEYQRGRIKNLLEKLPESERTVVTLHYLGEMTSKAISEFLGVSPNTVRSRLQRARNRLLKEQEAMIRETFGNVHLPPTFTENIMRRIGDIKPASHPGSRPLIPVAVSAATAIFIFLIMGVGSQYLARFQKPYNLNAQSEATVEIIDATIVLDTKAKPDLRNQAGRFDTTGKSKGSGPQAADPVMLAAAQVEKETRPSTKQQWIQASGPEKVGSVSGLLVSSWGDTYAASPIGIYKLAPNASTWMLVSPIASSNPPKASGQNYATPMAERNDVLYLVFPDGIFASKDRGKTWIKLGERPKGTAIGLAITNDALYLALRDEGIFRSTDGGKQWAPFNTEEVDSTIQAINAVENTMFVGTNQGLYRLYSEIWEKVSIDTTKAIHSLAVSGNNVYVGTGPNFSLSTTSNETMAYVQQLMSDPNAKAWEVFHSTDLGDSWTEITPTSKSPMIKASPGVTVLAVGDAVLALGIVNFRSTDGGKTWTEFDFNITDMNSMMNAVTLSMFPAVAVDENTIFKATAFGLTRSTDGGESWNSFMNGIVGVTIFNLVEFKNALYTSTSTSVTKSTDGGESWEKLPMDPSELTLKPEKKINIENLLIFPKLAAADDVLYGVAPVLGTESGFRIFRLSTNGSVLVPIQGIPTLSEDPAITGTTTMEDVTRQLEKFFGAFAVSRETFYVEYTRQLLRWKRGEPEWFNTGLIDEGKSTDDENSDYTKGFKLAVLDETVYVGKRDGNLFQSLDSGNTWKDLTSNLPLRFEHFNAIVFAGSTVYIATDAGVLTSADGGHWGVITDKAGSHTITDQIAVDATRVYGAGAEGIYQLNNRGEWEKISPEVPDTVISLVINGDKLYIATERRGMFYISLQRENDYATQY